MHLNNIFILECPRTTFKIKYVTRDNQHFVFFLSMSKTFRSCSITIDQQNWSLPGVTFRHAHRFNPKNHTAVTSRFSLHNPQHRTRNKQYKLMQHVRNTAINTSPIYKLVRNTCYNGSKRRHCLSEEALYKVK